MNKLYLVGNAHLDPVWLWDWREGFAEIRATFRSALDRMEEFGDFVFTSSSAAYYEWIEQVDPGMFREIRERVEEGRWVLCGGWWVQPDCNIPCGESLVRQGLVAQRYFRKKLGSTSSCGYNVDSFGHAGCLPQILRKSGMTSYVFMRPSGEENGEIPALFAWVGNDGTALPAYRIQGGYNSNGEDLREKILAHRAEMEREGQPRMCFYGVGNHGGGPTVENLRTIRAMEEEGLDLALSSPPAFFAAEGVGERAYPGSLLHHAIGCYSANNRVKQLNQRAEGALLEAERLCATAGALAGLEYPAGELRGAWKNLLFNQFHDILGGCSLERACEDAAHQLGEALSIAGRASNLAAQSIAARIDTLQGRCPAGGKTGDWRLWEHEELGTPLVAFNPSGYPVRAPALVNRPVERILSPAGEEIPFQVVRGEQADGKDKYAALFSAHIPALGYAVYRVFPRKEIHPPQPCETGDLVLENEFLLAEISRETGGLKRLLDKRGERELITAPSRFVVLDDRENDTWAHGARCFSNRCGEFRCEEAFRSEEGPVRSSLRVRCGCGSSRLTLDYRLYREGEALEVEIAALWLEERKILRLELPCNAPEGELVHSLPFGHEKKRADGAEQPVGRWCALADGKGGLAVASRGVFSGMAQGGMLGLTLLRSAYFADHYGDTDSYCRPMDQGEHSFRLLLAPCPGEGDYSPLERLSQALLQPPVFLAEHFHNGDLPASLECLRITPAEGIRLSAWKRAEDGKGCVMRLEETGGRARSAQVKLPIRERRWEIRLEPFEVNTYYIPDSLFFPVEEVMMTEWK